VVFSGHLSAGDAFRLYLALGETIRTCLELPTLGNAENQRNEEFLKF
jgi:hypothetical protein